MSPQQLFDGAQTPDDLARPLYGARFPDACRRYFRNYATFTGRASRSEYWWAFAMQGLAMLVGLILVWIGAALMATSQSAGNAVIWSGVVAMTAVVIACLVPNLAISWRRLHDTNLGGPMYFLSCIPYLGGLILLILLAMPSKPEGRRFDLPRWPR
ncbi:DUF805 domain-containing protein [Cellulomonas sp. NPDC089187]|uniref:DUF805 domain-containing protein n=1 Tax=Cellulomonas sp. NPDC089187 TaxID=3154970 RepID=UPI00341DF30A